MPRAGHLDAGRRAAPEETVAAARQAGCRSIAYTYTEPTIFFEYAYDTARLASDAGLANAYITNGYMTTEMLERFAPYLDAANVDLKAFRDQTYRKYVGARLEPVLESLRGIKRLGIWLEVTTLVIPGINDGRHELADVVGFIAEELGVDTPWHVSAFYPAYEMTNVPATPLSKLEEAAQIGREAGLIYVYLGNVASGEETFCPHCGATMIRRSRYTVVENRLRAGGICPQCGTAVAGIGMGKDPRGNERRISV